MTPQERQLIDNLFDRLAGLENAPRDPEAERAIIEGLRKAPNAAYALVQTALLQDEALKRANARIEELQASLEQQQGASQSQHGGSFLDSMREAVFGGSSPNAARGSVPNVRPADPGASRPVWNSGQVTGGGDPRYAGYAAGPGAGYNPGYGAAGYGGPGYGGPGYGAAGYGAPQVGGGSSFLGTAAAAAVGVVGGSMLMSGIRGLMGGHQAFAGAPAFSGDTGGPWSGDLGNSDLARDAGINDIGIGGHDSYVQNQGLLDDTARDDYASTDNIDDDDGFDNDGGGGGDDTDFA
jgi:hypothetical protein